MEVWILLAAAGSGYLARRWQNAQKPKASQQGEDEEGADYEDIIRASSSSATSSVRGQRLSNKARYRGLEGPRTGKAKCGKDPFRAGQPTQQSVTGCNEHVKSKPVNDKQNVNNLTNEEDHSSKNHAPYAVEDLCDHLSSMRLSENCDSSGLRDAEYKALKLSPGKRPNDANSGDACGSGTITEGGKGIKDAVASTSSPITSNDKEDLVFGTLMPGYWDVSEGVFVLDTESILMQHGNEVKGKSTSSSRRSRTPNRYGRSKSHRRKLLSAMKPLSSLESCLSAQLDGSYMRTPTQTNRSHYRRPSQEILSHTLEIISGIGKSENTAIGLPALSGQVGSRNPGNTCRTPRTFISPNSKWRYLKDETGLTNISLERLRFSFGVGVGIMFTVLSRIQEEKRLNLLLKDVGVLVKDLEIVLQSREQQLPTDTQAKMMKSITDTVTAMKALIINGSETPLDDISRLEAELEAELERMELNLGDEDTYSHENSNPGAVELEGDVGNLVKGELTVMGLPHNFKVESEEDNSSESSQEDHRFRSYAVSPRDLARRLHEVLERQQQQRISELEAQIELLESKLHIKEEEVEWWKGRSSEHVPGTAALLFGQSQTSYNTLPKTEEQVLHSKVSQVSKSSSPVIYGASKKSYSLNREEEQKSTAFITLGDEALAAYKEACDEFSKISVVDERKENSFDEVKKLPLKESRDNLPQVKPDCWEQVDLLSLAQDFYVNGDPLPVQTNVTAKGTSHRRSSQKGSTLRHPEPESHLTNSRGFDSSDDATNDTSGSTPCSVKFMDVTTVSSTSRHKHSKEDQIELDDDPEYCHWAQLIRVGVNTPNQDEYASYFGLDNTNAEVVSSSKQETWNPVDDSDYYSDLDEQLGQLLIKRIVERTRKGSPIIQDAQSVLASLENIPSPECYD